MMNITNGISVGHKLRYPPRLATDARAIQLRLQVYVFWYKRMIDKIRRCRTIEIFRRWREVRFIPHPNLTLEGSTVVFAELRDTFSKKRVQAFVQTDSERIVEEQNREPFGRAIRLALLGNN